MTAVLDELETQQQQALARLDGISDECLNLAACVGELTHTLEGIYTLALAKARSGLDVDGLFAMWDKMVTICDSFADKAHDLMSRTPCPPMIDGIAAVRRRCDDKREFYRC